jgi:hypothetical protein
VRVVPLYGVDQTVGRLGMVSCVGEGEGRKDTEDSSGMINLHTTLIGDNVRSLREG